MGFIINHYKGPYESGSRMEWQPLIMVVLGDEYLASGRLPVLIDGKQQVVLDKNIAVVALLKGLWDMLFNTVILHDLHIMDWYNLVVSMQI